MSREILVVKGSSSGGEDACLRARPTAMPNALSVCPDHSDSRLPVKGLLLQSATGPDLSEGLQDELPLEVRVVLAQHVEGVQLAGRRNEDSQAVRPAVNVSSRPAWSAARWPSNR